MTRFKMKPIKAFAILMLCGTVVLAGAGCQSTEEKPNLVDQLMEAKNKYIGDIGADQKIIELLQISETIGNYKMVLKTDQQPYEIELVFDQLVISSSDINQKMEQYAVYIFALIENLDTLKWTYVQSEGGQPVTVELMRTAIQEQFGVQLQEIAQTKDNLQTLLDKFPIGQPQE